MSPLGDSIYSGLRELKIKLEIVRSANRLGLRDHFQPRHPIGSCSSFGRRLKSHSAPKHLHEDLMDSMPFQTSYPMTLKNETDPVPIARRAAWSGAIFLVRRKLASYIAKELLK